MASLNILNTTPDGQQQFTLSSVTPILTSNDNGSGIIFNPVSSSKTIILQDHEVPVSNSGVEYTLIEDGGGSGYLQIANAGQGKFYAGNVIYLYVIKCYRCLIDILLFIYSSRRKSCVVTGRFESNRSI